MNRREFNTILGCLPFVNFNLEKQESKIFSVFKPGTLNFIIGRPKTGKTLVAKHLWKNSFSEYGKKIANLTCFDYNCNSFVYENTIWYNDTPCDCHINRYNKDYIFYDNFGTGSARIPKEYNKQSKLYQDMAALAIDNKICIVCCVNCNYNNKVYYNNPEYSVSINKLMWYAMWYATNVLVCERNKNNTFKLTLTKTRELPTDYTESFSYKELI